MGDRHQPPAIQPTIRAESGPAPAVPVRRNRCHSHRQRIEIDYLIEGEGPETIVMVNGLADEKESWGYQTPDFVAAGYRVLTFDNRASASRASRRDPTPRSCSPRTPRRWSMPRAHRLPHGRHEHGRHDRPGIAIAYPGDLKSLVLSSTYAAPGPFCWPHVPDVGGHRTGVGRPLRHARRDALGLHAALLRDAGRRARNSKRPWRDDASLAPYLAQLSSIQTHDT